VPLLTAREERALCADIEKARAALAAALLAHPSSAAHFAGLCAAVRIGAATTDELLQSAEGGSLSANEIAQALHHLDRAARRAGNIALIDELLAMTPISSSSRKILQQRADRLVEGIGRTLVDVPLHPSLVEALAVGYEGSTGGASRRVRARFEALAAVKRRLVEANLRLVVSVARRYRATSLSSSIWCRKAIWVF
jgi:DNA-directed RNA polymerase sigma subunit (sigma70/sigma32)